MQYKVAIVRHERSYTGAALLEEQVNNFLKLGWKLLGGINICFNERDKDFVISQALYK